MAVSEIPITYFDHLHKSFYEAQKVFNTDLERELAPYIDALLVNTGIKQNLPPEFSSLFDALSRPSHPAIVNVMQGWTASAASAVSNTAIGAALTDFRYKANELFPNARIDPSAAMLLFSRKKITEDLFNSRMKANQFRPEEAELLYKASKPYPSIPDIIQYARYQGDPFNVRELVWNKYDVDVDDFDLWSFLSQVRLTASDIQTLYKRGIITRDEFVTGLGRVGYIKEDIKYLEELTYSIPNAMLLVQGHLVKGDEKDKIYDDIIKADIHPEYADLYYNAILTKPSTTEIINYMLRKDPDLSDLPKELEKIGIHPDYFDLYKTLAYPIPPLSDIITMAVREAFTPSIAARFGQYEDIPQDFIKYAAQKGLSKEWAERYWAAHWSLPSVTQGFEMLHRGIITREELLMLLRALDIMPFWRDKLIQLSYNVYNRVDIRRMYAAGVLDRAGVLKAYQEMGYDKEKAEKLTQYTVIQQRQSLSGITSKSLVNYYAKGLIKESDLVSGLRDLGISSEEINNIVNLAKYKKTLETKELKLKAVENLYKKKEIDEYKARAELSALGISTEEINLMLDKWKYVEKEEKIETWTTPQTLSLYKKGLITRERAIEELSIKGLSRERIDALLSSVEQTEED